MMCCMGWHYFLKILPFLQKIFFLVLFLSWTDPDCFSFLPPPPVVFYRLCEVQARLYFLRNPRMFLLTWISNTFFFPLKSNSTDVLSLLKCTRESSSYAVPVSLLLSCNYLGMFLSVSGCVPKSVSCSGASQLAVFRVFRLNEHLCRFLTVLHWC